MNPPVTAPARGASDVKARATGLTQLSPPGKVSCCLILVMGMATAPTDSPRALVAALIASAGVVAIVRPRAALLARRSLLALPLLAALVVPLLLWGELERGLSLGARAMSALMTTLAISTTLDPSELPHALSALRFPGTLVRLLGSMLRQATSVTSQARRIVLARRLRGARGRQVSAEVLSSLLAKTAQRAERVELSMRLRGAYATSRDNRRPLRATDAPALLGSAVAAIAIHAVAR